MKRFLICTGLVLVAGVSLYLGARHWVWTRTLRAIESATGAKAQAREFRVDLWANKVSLRGLTLVSSNAESYWERATAEEASSRILWGQRSPDVIPMEISLDGCLVTLRPSSATRLMKEQFRGNKAGAGSYAPPDTQTGESPSAERPHSPIQLTAITASKVDIQEGSTLFAEGLNASARRGICGWQGQLTANRVGSLPLTEVRVAFSSEAPATRLTEVSCNLKNGHVSGSGLISEESGAALDLKVDSLPLAAVAPQWCPVAGLVSTKLAYKGDPLRWQFGTFTGDFTLANATLQLGAASQVLNLLGATTSSGSTTPPTSVTGSVSLSGDCWELSNLSLTQSELFAITGNLACRQGAKLKADLNLGISKALCGQTVPAGSAGQDRFAWTGFSVETTPEQLWQGVVASLIKSVTAASTAAGPQAAAGPQGADPAKPTLQDKARSTANSLLNLLTR